MNKPVYFGLSTLELSKILMHEFWHDYVKPKYGEKAKLCYMDTDNFFAHIKTYYIYKGLTEDVEIIFYTLYYELDRPLPNWINKRGIRWTNHERICWIKSKNIWLFKRQQ